MRVSSSGGGAYPRERGEDWGAGLQPAGDIAGPGCGSE